MSGAPTQNLGSDRVLVVEDEALIGLMLADVLEEFGAAVVGPASNVAEALRLVEQGGLSLALLDLSLGGEEVYPVADRLAALGVPFAFITGYGQGYLAARHVDTPLLTKPFGASQLGGLLVKLGWAAS